MLAFTCFGFISLKLEEHYFVLKKFIWNILIENVLHFLRPEEKRVLFG